MIQNALKRAKPIIILVVGGGLTWLSAGGELAVETFKDLSSVLAVATGLVALIVSVDLVYGSPPRDLAKRLTGSIWVVSLCFAANNVLIYGAGVFIVATIVTDLEFLEKLAAIIWDREAYWRYRQRVATPLQVKTQQHREAEELARLESRSEAKRESNDDAAALVGDLHYRVAEFERAVLDALRKGEGPLPPGELQEHTRILGPGGPVEYDAVLETKEAYFLVEVKCYRARQSLGRAFGQVTRMVSTYMALLDQRGKTIPVIPILVVPAELEAPLVYRDIPVLSFDEEKQSFTNAREIGEVIETKLGKGE